MIQEMLISNYGYAIENFHCLAESLHEDYVTGSRIVTDETKKEMKKVLTEIQDGTFAKDFLLDMSEAGGQAHFKAMRKLASEHISEKTGEDVRKLYAWSDEDKLINN